MGIRFCCPNGHKLNVKTELAGKVGVCPKCGAKTAIPTESVFTPEEFRSLREPNAFGDANDSAQSSSSESEKRGAPSDSGSAFVDAASDASDDGQFASANASQSDSASDADAQNGLRAAFDDDATTDRRRENWFDDADDPLQDPNVVWCVQTPDNRSYGPAPSSTLKTWIQEKRISPEMFVWREGWERWEEAGAVFPEVRRIFALDGAEDDAEPDALGDEPTRNVTGAAFATLAEAARSSATTRRLVDDEATSRRRRDKARQTFGVIVALTALVVALSGVLVYVLFFR